MSFWLEKTRGEGRKDYGCSTYICRQWWTWHCGYWIIFEWLLRKNHYSTTFRKGKWEASEIIMSVNSTSLLKNLKRGQEKANNSISISYKLFSKTWLFTTYNFRNEILTVHNNRLNLLTSCAASPTSSRDSCDFVTLTPTTLSASIKTPSCSRILCDPSWKTKYR